MPLPFNISKNLAQSTLASGYTAGNTTITVQTGDGAQFDAGPFVVAIDNPPQFFLEVTSVSGDTLTVNTSGFDGSTPVSVTSATPVTEVISAGVLSALLTNAATTVIPNSAASAPSTTVPQTGWSLQNASNAHGSVNDFMPNELVMSSGNFGAAQWSALTRNLSVPYTIIATIEARGQVNGDTASFVAGVCISDATKYEYIGNILASNTANLGLEVVTVATLASGGSALAGPTSNLVGPTLTVKIVNDSTHRTFYYWSSGTWVQFYQEATGTYLTETKVGIISLCDVAAGGYTLDVALRYWSGA